LLYMGLYLSTPPFKTMVYTGFGRGRKGKIFRPHLRFEPG
jgi:hypothetical protein